jgi:hypothetical protein
MAWCLVKHRVVFIIIIIIIIIITTTTTTTTTNPQNEAVTRGKIGLRRLFKFGRACS